MSHPFRAEASIVFIDLAGFSASTDVYGDGGEDRISALPGASVARKRDAPGAAVGGREAVVEPQKRAGGSLVFSLVLVALIAALAAGAIAFLQLYR